MRLCPTLVKHVCQWSVGKLEFVDWLAKWQRAAVGGGSSVCAGTPAYSVT